jgi:hypothetical protein
MFLENAKAPESWLFHDPGLSNMEPTTTEESPTEDPRAPARGRTAEAEDALSDKNPG